MCENAGSAAATAARSRIRRPESWRLAPRQPHREHRALARLAGHRHIAAQHARELAGDCKDEPGTAKALRGRRVGLVKLLKQLGFLLRRHADAAVGNGQLDPVATVADSARSKLDVAL